MSVTRCKSTTPSIKYPKHSHSTATQHDTALHSVLDTQRFSDPAYTAIQAIQAFQEPAPSSPDRTVQGAVRKAFDLGGDKDAKISMWILARSLKADYLPFRSLPTECLEKELGNALSIWWAMAKLDPEDIQDFSGHHLLLIAAFARARTSLDENTLDQVVNRAPPLDRKLSIIARSDRLLWVCRELQKENGGKSFFLTYRSAAEILGTSDQWAARDMFALFMQRKLIVLVKKGHRKVANEYTFIDGSAA